MKKHVFTVGSLAMLSCRAVLGIEDLPGDGGASSSSSSSSSGSSSSGGTSGDSGTKDTGAGGDAGGDASCAAMAAGDCIKCCRDAFKGNMQFDGVLRASQCVCGGASSCASQCGGFCDGGDPMTAGMTCFPCADPLLLQNVADCPQTLDQLPPTGELGVCFKSCKH